MKLHPEPRPLFLKPGEWYCGQEPVVITTILGSCIAVTMFHRKTQLAAMCHALMPVCEEKVCRRACKRYSRYVDCIVPKMARHYFDRGIGAGSIEVKLFGGGHSLSVNSGARDSLRVGTRNFELARICIEQEGLRLATSDVGGSRGRKLLFDTYSGEVLLKRLHMNTGTGTGRFLIEQITGGEVSRRKAV